MTKIVFSTDFAQTFRDCLPGPIQNKKKFKIFLTLHIFKLLIFLKFSHNLMQFFCFSTYFHDFFLVYGFCPAELKSVGIFLISLFVFEL